MRGLSRLWIIPTAIAAAAIACSSSESNDGPKKAPDAGTDAADAEPSPVGDAGSEPDAAPAYPTSFEKCVISDSPASASVVATVTTAAATFLYMGFRNNGGAPTTRRYILTSASPCVLDRDIAFGTVGEVGGLFGSADTQEALWVVGNDVRRFEPMPAIVCGPPLSAEPERLALDEDGKVGWVFYRGDDVRVGRVAFDGTKCAMSTVSLVATPKFIPSHYLGAVDTKGRLHAIGAVEPKLEAVVHIFDATGQRVGSYPTKGADGLNGTQLARCFGGMCMNDATTVWFYTTDGDYLRTLDFPPPTAADARYRLAAMSTGPIFAITTETSQLDSAVVAFIGVP